MNITPRKIECHDTWQICKMGIHGLKKLLLTISMNLSQKKIQAMISHQHQNVDVAIDVDRVDEVAEEEEHINVKQTSHPKENELKLYHHALYHPINLKHHPQDNRLEPYHRALYHPISLNLKLKHHPQDHNQHPSLQSSPIGMHNTPLAVGQSGHHPNAQLFYGPLVPQKDEDCLLCGRQPTIVMYNHIIQKCYTCDVRYDPNFMCPPT